MNGIERLDALLLKSLMQTARQLEAQSRSLVIKNAELHVTRTLLLAGFFRLSDSLELGRAD